MTWQEIVGEAKVTKGHKPSTPTSRVPSPGDSREALQWFVNNFGLYVGSVRGLIVSDWTQEQEPSLEAAVISLKSRGFAPLVLSGEMIARQSDYLWAEAQTATEFGRPYATKMELELLGADVVVVDWMEAPENARQLWYMFNHLFYPRALSGKATVVTTPLSYQEFINYGQSCPDVDFCGKSINWEKLVWVMEATMVNLDLFGLAKETGTVPMLQAESYLYQALVDRTLKVIPQHVLGDYMLDFALVERDKRLAIEVDNVSALGSGDLQRQSAKRDLVLLSDGWQILKFTTAEILNSRLGCAEAIDDVWRGGRKRGIQGRLLTGTNAGATPDLPAEDECQTDAISHGGGPAAVTGGAGTGKTTCLVHRVAHLVAAGIAPESVLVVTHSADTVKSLRRMLESVLDKQILQKLPVFAWQDLGQKILKENLPAIRRKPPLKIETNTQKVIAKLLAKHKKEEDPSKLELSADIDEFYIAAVISMYKTHLISPKRAKEEAGSYADELIAKIYQALDDQLQKANRIDRDDVTAMAVQVLLDNADTRKRYQEQYEYVLVDEYQDVTVAEDTLIRVLSAPQDNLYLCGDEDETITEGKNACPDLFAEISLRLPQARCYKLERNWRSHPAIVDHARQLLAGLERRKIAKELLSAWGQSAPGAIVGPQRLPDEKTEADWVASEIQLLVDSGRQYGEIAILYRHNVYAPIVQEALTHRGIRYMASVVEAALVPDEVEDMMAYLKLVMDPDGPRARESFERVCQLRVKEIDPKLSATIAGFAEANNLSYLKAVEIYSEATSDQSCRELEQLVRIIRTMNQEKLPPAEAISLIKRTQRLADYYKSVKVPPGINYEPLRKLGQLEEEARQFKTVPELVKYFSGQGLSAVGGSDAGVQLQAIQDTKGQEYPVVFLIGMAEGIFPAENTIDPEEERRICYVGFTRAKELLYVSFPATFSGVALQASHFLADARLMPAQAPQHYVPLAEPQYVQPQQPASVEPQYVQPPPAPQPAYVEPQYVQPPAAPQPAYVEPQYVQPQAPLEPAYVEPQYEEPPYEEPVYEEPPAPVAPPPPVAPVRTPPTPPPEPEYITSVQAGLQQYKDLAAQMQSAAAPAPEPEPIPEPVVEAVVEPVVPEPPAPVVSPPPAPVEPAAPVQEQVSEESPKARNPFRVARATPITSLPKADEPAPEPVEEPAVKPLPMPELPPMPSKPAEPVIKAMPKPELPPLPSKSAEPPVRPLPKPDLPPMPSKPAPQLVQPEPIPVAAQSEEQEWIISAPADEQKPATVAPAEAPAQAMPPAAEAAPIDTGKRMSALSQALTRKAVSAVPAEKIESPAPVQEEVPVAPAPVIAPPVQATTPPVELPVQPAAQIPTPPVMPPPVMPVQTPVQPPAPPMPPMPVQTSVQPPAPPMPPVMPVQTPVQPPTVPVPPAMPEQSAARAVPPQEIGMQPTRTVPPPVHSSQPPLPGQAFIQSQRPAPPGLQPYTADSPRPAAASSNEQPAWMHPSQDTAAQPSAYNAPAPTEFAAQAPTQGSDVFGNENELEPWRKQMMAQQQAMQAAQEPGPYQQTENWEQMRRPQTQPPQPPQYQEPQQPQYQQPQQPQYQQPQQPQYQQPQQSQYQQPQQPQQGSMLGNAVVQPAYVSHMNPHCPSCNFQLEPNARFCGGCGYSLPERIPACPTCGAPLEADAKFCGECGTSMLDRPVTQGSQNLQGNLMRMNDLRDKQQGWMVKFLKMLE